MDRLHAMRIDGRKARDYKAAGLWPGRTIADDARRLVAERPDHVILVDDERRITAADALAQAKRLVAWLQSQGLATGTSIAYQLPNWHEAAVINLAAALGGYVVVPLVPIYRDREVGFILDDASCRVVFVPETFRRHDYLGMLDRLRPSLPGLKHVVTVRGAAGGSGPRFEDILAQDLPCHPVAVDPDSCKLILYTSGTTGRAKGVMHSHNTLMSDLDATIAFWNIRGEDSTFMPSPVTHITGYLYALELPFITGSPAVLLDVWNRDRALDLLAGHRCTLAFGATPFLTELLDAIEHGGRTVPSLRLWPCGGTSVSPDLVQRGRRLLENCAVCRIYGATEAPTVTLGVRRETEAQVEATVHVAAHTDGVIVNNEVRIVDPATGKPVADGEEGEICVRGPELFLGYTRTEDNKAFDTDGFFKTGDLGRIDPGNSVTVTGRLKDLIIRGGENISPKEIEDALLGHPAVAETAVVSMPHQRLGEGVCAFIVLREGHEAVGIQQLSPHLQAQGLAKQKIPERIEIVGDLPKTASGKVRKDLLREQAAKAVDAEAGS